jgi:hypothetical protein
MKSLEGCAKLENIDLKKLNKNDRIGLFYNGIGQQNSGK